MHCRTRVQPEAPITLDLFVGRLPLLLAAMKKSRRAALEASQVLAKLLTGTPEADSDVPSQLWQMGACGCLSKLLVTTEDPEGMKNVEASQGEGTAVAFYGQPGTLA